MIGGRGWGIRRQCELLHVLGFIRGRVGVEGDLLTVVVLANSALVGIVISLTPLSCDLMGLFGAGGNGAAGV